jgi:hypothetical protein
MTALTSFIARSRRSILTFSAVAVGLFLCITFFSFVGQDEHEFHLPSKEELIGGGYNNIKDVRNSTLGVCFSAQKQIDNSLRC